MKGRILLVDDEETLVRSYKRILSSAGFEVETSPDGRGALEMFQGGAFDLIVSDIMMPRMDGISFLRSVRERDLDIPVVLMTANPVLESATQAIEYGALRYLIKPIEPKLLIATAEKAVQLHELARIKREALKLLGLSGRQLGDLAALDARFGRALKSIWMAYQPIIRWSDRKLFGYEALVRTGEETLPHPGALIDAAERLGLERLHEMGRTIRSAVASSLADISSDAMMFVNLHTEDLLDPSLLSEEAPLSKLARRVVLEVTERSALEKVRDVRQRVASLRALGYRIAIDDLGAGYAGLTSFAHLEPDIVKIDMSLVRDVDKEPTKRKLIQSLVVLCADLGIGVVAEGIETIAERDVLVDIGCDLFQGYLFARPSRPFPAVDW